MSHHTLTLTYPRVHTQMTEFTLQNTQVHIHRNARIRRDTVKCALSHSQTHVLRTSRMHTETLTEAAPQQTGTFTQRMRSVQCCTHARAETQRCVEKHVDATVSLHSRHCTQARTCTHTQVPTDAHTDNMHMCPGHPT